MRINKFLASCNVASRRHSEELVLGGRVKINGVTIEALSTQVDPEKDVVTLDGNLVNPLVDTELCYVALHKPIHVISTMTDPFDRPCVGAYVRHIKQRLFHVGRLDGNSEGLIIMTNDGDLAQQIAHPSMHIKKGYHVQVRGVVSQDKLALLCGGTMRLDDKTVAPCRVNLIQPEAFLSPELVKQSAQKKHHQTHDRLGENNPLPSLHHLEFWIHEGMNRQIRRMCDMVELEVVRLVRIQYGGVHLGKMPPGTSRTVTRAQILADEQDSKLSSDEKQTQN